MYKPGSTDYKRMKNSELYDRLDIVVPKGRKATIKVYAKERGQSVNDFINGLIRADMGLTEEEWKGRGE